MQKILIPLCIVVAIFFVFKKNSNNTSVKNVTSDISCEDGSSAKLIMFTTKWCGYCKKARSLAQANNINYCEYDIEESNEGHSIYKKLGGKGVPVIVVDGKVTRGYSERAILSAK